MDRYSRRKMLAAIALTDLPAPVTVRFDDESPLLVLSLDNIAEGRAWMAELGGIDQSFNSEGQVHLSHSRIDWHGWSVHIHANEPMSAVEPLDADTAAKLTRVQ